MIQVRYVTDRYDKIVETVSLVIGLMNLQENLTQGDKQDLMDNIDKKTKNLLDQIHEHLENQDKKLDKIYEMVYNIINNNKGGNEHDS